MIQNYQARKFNGTAADRRKVMEDAGHMLNRLRSVAEEAGQPLTTTEEEAFWNYIHILPLNTQSSIIN